MQKPILIKIIGSSAKARVLNFLIKGRGLDYSMSDIARNSNIGWTTLNTIWNDFMKLSIVKHTRIVGKAKLYTLNISNPIIKILVDLYKQSLLQETEKHFTKKQEKNVKHEITQDISIPISASHI